MTDLPGRAIAAIEKLPPDVRDAIAMCILDEVADQCRWEALLAATTDEQWGRMAAIVRREIQAGETMPFDEIFARDSAEP